MKSGKSFINVKPANIFLRQLLFLLFVFTFNIATANQITPGIFPGFHDSIIVKTSKSSKTHIIKLYPNATNEVLFFSAKGEEGKVYQLFLFDMDGKLAKVTQVRNRETTLLVRFEKGNYLFEVFSNDDQIENGSITVR